MYTAKPRTHVVSLSLLAYNILPILEIGQLHYNDSVVGTTEVKNGQ